MKKLLSLALAAAMTLSLVACSGGKTTEPEQPDTPDASQSGMEQADTTIDPEETYKKEVIITASTAFAKPDPQTASSFQNTRIYQLVYDRLVYYNPTTQEMEPMLAESWESADGLTWTLKLREDVTFHNGEKFTADDVVFTWERGKESSEANVKRYCNAIVSCEAEGDYTVKMTLDKANADFLLSLTFPYMCMLNREACEADPENGYLVGTGLWIWETHEADDYDSFNRNDNYWGGTTPTEHLVQRLIPEASARLIALENGEVDVAQGIAQTEVDFVRENENLDLIEVNQVTLQYLGFNTEKEGITQNADFRKACAHAIDWDNFILGYKNGNATQAQTVWSHAQFGYAPQESFNNYDVELAKDYLAKSGYSGETLTILTQTGYTSGALILQDMFSKVGINIESVEVAAANYSTEVKAGNFDMSLYQLSFTSAGSDITRLLTNSNGSKAMANAAQKDAIFALCDQALAASDDAERLELYAHVQELLAEDAAIIPLIYPMSFTATAKGLTGVQWAANTDYDYRFIKVPEA